MNLPVNQLMEIGGKIPVRPAAAGHTPDEVAALLRRPIRRLIMADTPPDEGAAPHPGYPVDIEHHSHCELHFVLAGEVFFSVEQRPYRVTAGDLLYLRPWERHEGWPIGKPESALVAIFHFSQTPWACVNHAPMSPADSILSDSWIFLPEVLAAFFLARCRQASAAPFATDFARLARPAMRAVLDDYARTFAHRVRQRLLAKTDPLEKIAVHIRDHAGRGCSNMALSTLSGIPVHRLRSAYLARFAITPREAIDQARLDLYKLSKVMAMRQKEIANILGFASVQSFARWAKGYRDSE